MDITPDTASRTHSPRTCGVYQIYNKASGKSYVGATMTFAVRWTRHRSELRHGKHPNVHLQRAWSLYGEAAFEFRVLCLCSVGDLGDREAVLIAQHKALNWQNGYNHRLQVGEWVQLSQETRDKMSRAQQGKKDSEETRQRKSIALTGHPVTEETRAKLRSAGKRRGISAETGAKISAANTGKKRTEATKAKMRVAATGRVLSEETKEKIRQANLGKKASQEARAKMSAARQGRKMSDETRAKIRAAATGRVLSEETKEKIRQARLKRIALRKQENEPVDQPRMTLPFQ